MKKHKIYLWMLVCVLMLALVGCAGKVVDVGEDSSTGQESSSELVSSEQSSSGESAEASSEESSSEETTSAEESEPEPVEEQPAAPLTPEDTSSAVDQPQQTVNHSKPYLIRVNRALNTATVYQKDEEGEFTDPVKAIVVSCGGSNTPLGTFRISSQYRWKLMMDDVYAQYASRVTGPILIHSVPYYTPSNDDLCYRQYNLLGQTASHGCIRMTVADAKWVMDHCASGTTVEIYDDYSSPGPLGKPKAQKIPLDSKYRGWDPTDPDSRNPWHKLGEPTIKGVKDRTVELGGKFDPLKKVTAVDGTGTDITDSIKVKGKVDTGIVGEYELTYSVADGYGNSAEKKALVTVSDTTAPNIKISSTESFTAESEQAGCNIIRSRITFSDLSGIADSSVELSLSDKTEQTETITVPAEPAEPSASAEEGAEPEESAETAPLAEQTLIRTTVTYTYTALITVSDCYGNANADEAVFTFTVISESTAAE